MKNTVFAAAGLAIVMASSATAQVERKNLLSYKNWTVDYVVEDDFYYCDAYTMAERDTWLSVAVFDGSGAVNLIVRNPNWELSKREANILIDVDYSRFEGAANLEGNFVAVSGLSSNFIKALIKGNAIAFKDERGNSILTFSLSGSAAAIYKLQECTTAFKEIEAKGNASDPFARNGAGQIGDTPQVFGK